MTNMNKIIKNIIVFFGALFAIFMGFFGVAGLFAAATGTRNYGEDPMYFLTIGLLCLAIASTSLFLSVKLYYHR